jgi:hypothetical protein
MKVYKNNYLIYTEVLFYLFKDLSKTYNLRLNIEKGNIVFVNVIIIWNRTNNLIF